MRKSLIISNNEKNIIKLSNKLKNQHKEYLRKGFKRKILTKNLLLFQPNHSKIDQSKSKAKDSNNT